MSLPIPVVTVVTVILVVVALGLLVGLRAWVGFAMVSFIYSD